MSVTDLYHLVRAPSTYSVPMGTHPRVHSKNLDRQFGYKIPKIEEKLVQKYRHYDQAVDESNKKQHYQGTQTWIGLHPQVLQTPYSDLFNALQLLTDYPIRRVVDIGAGYGRVGLVMSSLFPDSEFIGFEILKKREQEANRIFSSLGLNNCKVYLENVLEEGFTLPKAEVYFIYDFSEITDISKILDQLKSRIHVEDFFLITKGDRMDQLLEVKYKPFWITNGILKIGDLKIYSSNTNLKNII